MKPHTLSSMFAGLFRKQGFNVVEVGQFDMVEFSGPYFKGVILFNKERKKHIIRWSMKSGYELFDVPVSPGSISAEFNNVSDLLNFLQRRLIWKKQK